MEKYLPPKHLLVKNRNIERSLKCARAKDVLNTPSAHTPHFCVTVLTFQLKLQLIHELFFGPSLMCQNLLIVLVISTQHRRNYSQRIQHVTHTLAAASLYYEVCWENIPELSLTMWKME